MGKVEELIARNFWLIPSEIQEKIKEVRVLFVGCGLGSQIAVLAARTGFTHFKLWDGDKVELSNLNRQAFNREDLGLNKAEVTARLLKAINLEIEVESRPEFLRKPNDIKEAVAKADIVLNTADPDEVMYLVDEMAAERGIPSFFPLNVGFGGFVLVFTPQSQRLEEMVEGRTLGNECFIQILQASIPYLPESFQGELERFRDIEKKIPPFPQLGIAVHLTSALVVTAMIRWLRKDPTLPVAPQPLWLSSWF